MTYFISILFLILVAFNTSSNANPKVEESIRKDPQSTTIELMLLQDDLPYSYKVTDNPSGLYVFILDELFKNIPGEILQISIQPNDIVTNSVESGHAGTITSIKNARTLKLFDYSDSIFSEYTHLYVRKGETFDYSDIKSLRGRVIGLNSNFELPEEFNKEVELGNIKIITSSSFKQNYINLMEGTIDVLLDSCSSASFHIKSLHMEESVSLLPKPFGHKYAYIIFSKTAEKKELLGQLNSVIVDFKASQRYSSLAKRWSWRLNACCTSKYLCK